MENIDKSFTKFKDDLSDIKIGRHVYFKKNWAKNGQRLITRKLNIRNEHIIETITNKYYGGIYTVKNDESISNFMEGE